jgi:hypothetical protein
MVETGTVEELLQRFGFRSDCLCFHLFCVWQRFLVEGGVGDFAEVDGAEINVLATFVFVTEHQQVDFDQLLILAAQEADWQTSGVADGAGVEVEGQHSQDQSCRVIAEHRIQLGKFCQYPLFQMHRCVDALGGGEV